MIPIVVPILARGGLLGAMAETIWRTLPIRPCSADARDIRGLVTGSACWWRARVPIASLGRALQVSEAPSR
jgi:hypothetical protein